MYKDLYIQTLTITVVVNFAAELCDEKRCPKADSERIIVVTAAGSTGTFNCSGFELYEGSQQKACTPVNTGEAMENRKPFFQINLTESDEVVQGKLSCCIRRTV